MAGQHELEWQALDAWSRREPAAAYTFAACHKRHVADELLHNTFSRDEQAALAMLRSRVDRNGCGGIPDVWMERDPAHACAVLATLPNGLKQGSLLRHAFATWAKRDAAAAIASALALSGKDRTSEAISGVMGCLSPADAASLTLKLKDPEQMKSAAWQLMVNWGRKDPAAATAWAMENLPPAGLAHAIYCFECNVIHASEHFKDQKRADVLAAFTPAAWLATAEHLDAQNAPLYLEGAPEWFLPRIYERLPGKTADLTRWAEPEKAPEWFRQLPEKQTAEVIQAMAKRESQRESWPSLTSIPPHWQDAAARGILENMTGPRGAVEEKVLALPSEERALLRAQLPNMDQLLPKLPRLRELLDE